MLAIILSLIFIRPFISSSAFTSLDLTYSTVTLIFLSIWAIAHRKLLKKTLPETLFAPLTLFILSLTVSLYFSFDKIAGLIEFHKYITYLMFFLTTLSLTSEDKSKVIRVIILTGLIISLIAIYQYFIGFNHFGNYLRTNNITDNFILDYAGRNRVFLPFVTPNALAGYLILILPLVFCSPSPAKTGIFQEKWIILSFLIFALLLTKSLGTLLALFLGAGLYLCLRKNISYKKILLLGILGITIGFIFIYRGATKQEHILPAFSLAKRLDYWRETLAIIKIHPLSGVGLGNFFISLGRYAHNAYLQIWAEMGLLGIISFLWLVIRILKIGWSNIENSLHKKETLGLIIAVIIFLIHNFVDFTFFLPEVSLTWWIILGLII